MSQFVKIDLTGEDSSLWSKLRSKLIISISALMETVINPKSGATVLEEGRDLISALIENTKDRLARQGFENEKISAEIARIYAEAETAKAGARKLNAEAEAIELQNSISKLKFILISLKAIIIGEEGCEAIALTKQVDVFIENLKSLETSKDP